jgi:hypothetical protein
MTMLGSESRNEENSEIKREEKKDGALTSFLIL